MNPMTDGEVRNTRAPAAVFVGDFNVGKSFLLNAVVRSNLLATGREESRILPTLMSRSLAPEAVYAAYTPQEPEPISKTHAQFVSIRWDGRMPREYDALAALLPDVPFNRLILVDTPGGSSELHESAVFKGLRDIPQTLFVVTTNIEYWPARHTMELIAAHHTFFADRFVVAANMADQLNPDEIRRIRDKAARRMEDYGIKPAPPFFAVSARLEFGRSLAGDEYRRRIKSQVRELCDAGFDALRVALYEFEAKHAGFKGCASFAALFDSDIARALMSNRDEDKQ